MPCEVITSAARSSGSALSMECGNGVMTDLMGGIFFISVAAPSPTA